MSGPASVPAEPARPLRVLLVCAAGMSSSLVETSLEQAAQAGGVDLALRSMSAFELENTDLDGQQVDAILVAPQVRLLRRGLERRAGPAGIAVVLIDPMDFGMADGAAILRKLLAAVAPA